MSLTRREQRTLARIERALTVDDPRLARFLSRPGQWNQARAGLWNQARTGARRGASRVVLNLLSVAALAALAGVSLVYGLAR
jgi:Protein of unknown function (DUF3040)